MFVTVQVDGLEVNAEKSYVFARILWTVLSTKWQLKEFLKCGKVEIFGNNVKKSKLGIRRS